MWNKTKKLHTSRHLVHYVLAALVLMLCVPLLTGLTIVRSVTVKADGQEKVLQTNTEKIEQIITEAGFTLGPHDSYRLLGFNKKVQDGSIIEVVRAKKFTVVYNDQEKVYQSSKNYIGEALTSIGLVYDKDKVYPGVLEPLTQDERIYVVNKNEELELTTNTLPVPVKYVEDSSLARGVEKVDQAGKVGSEKIISKRVHQADGTVVQKEIGRKLLAKAEPKIIRKGIALSVWTPEGYKKYSRVLYCEATAYTHTGSCTALGFTPYEGIVAVDPLFIPLYTKLYIPGYGMAMAGDTGGDMVDNRIDVFFNSYASCIEWGCRDVEVYILEE